MQLSTRLAIAMVALVCATAAAVGVLNYRDIAQRILPGELYRMEVSARTLVDLLGDHVAAARSDIVTLRAAPSTEGILNARRAGGTDPEEGESEARWRARLLKVYLGQMKAQPATFRIRLIGVADNARELIRLERSAPG